MKFIPKNEQEFRKQNPFEPVYDKHLTKAQKNETIAHFMYEIDNTVGKVEYIDGWFHINDDPDCQDRFGVPIHNCYSIEVIGNIHENPGLLGGKNEIDN